MDILHGRFNQGSDPLSFALYEGPLTTDWRMDSRRAKRRQKIMVSGISIGLVGMDEVKRWKGRKQRCEWLPVRLELLP